jgi:hypothetical protein
LGPRPQYHHNNQYHNFGFRHIDKKANQSEDDILQLNEEEALLFDKPKESKTKFRSQSKSSKSSKPAALGKAPSSRTPGNVLEKSHF